MQRTIEAAIKERVFSSVLFELYKMYHQKNAPDCHPIEERENAHTHTHTLHLIGVR